MKVFARLPQRVLWKWETEDMKGLPDNVLVLKWLPQYDLLSKLITMLIYLNNYAGTYMYVCMDQLCSLVQI